ncbi:helix-turn-helix domain-containing protein [Saccharopolyspora oryzae]|uniref:Helix-turn-helix domain-containing protein n=1 Tax=Saccharopolyspora oryzae TaxID=2997343 RepID=A0ABT4UW88_9PSEU|nr:helix-turn-helix domain-containing protein [Saccharopolyspora oryzae]MDA3625991.1 helix-turn-helix domain-containing protein [Saccharopolyspora oryzae]
MARDVRELGGAWRDFQRHSFPEPSPDLARYVARYWVVSWDYPEPYRQLIVPYPNVHLTFQDGRATITGVSSGHQVRVLSGRSSVLGVAFRPGCFRPFLRAPVSTITDRTIDAREVFGPALTAPDVPAVEQLLRAHAPEPDPRAEQAADIVAMIAAKPEITRVDALAREFGTSIRQLQRLFAEHVGIGPKWVIRRYRLHEVTERMARGAELDWASVAAELGYADQAHLTRDFKSLFGEPPTHHAQRY